MKRTIPVFAALAAIALALPASHAQTLTGAQAQKSPQAEVFLAYEKGLIAQGMDGARSKGDYAVLEARDSPNVVTVQHLVKTKDGWKVGVRR